MLTCEDFGEIIFSYPHNEPLHHDHVAPAFLRFAVTSRVFANVYMRLLRSIDTISFVRGNMLFICSTSCLSLAMPVHGFGTMALQRSWYCTTLLTAFIIQVKRCRSTGVKHVYLKDLARPIPVVTVWIETMRQIVTPRLSNRLLIAENERILN